MRTRSQAPSERSQRSPTEYVGGPTRGCASATAGAASSRSDRTSTDRSLTETSSIGASAVALRVARAGEASLARIGNRPAIGQISSTVPESPVGGDMSISAEQREQGDGDGGVVDHVGDHAGQEAAGALVEVGPEQARGEHAGEPGGTVAVGETEHEGARHGGHRPAEARP